MTTMTSSTVPGSHDASYQGLMVYISLHRDGRNAGGEHLYRVPRDRSNREDPLPLQHARRGAERSVWYRRDATRHETTRRDTALGASKPRFLLTSALAYTRSSKAHGSLSRGRKVTLAVICRMMAWISLWISFCDFRGASTVPLLHTHKARGTIRAARQTQRHKAQPCFSFGIRPSTAQNRCRG